MCNKLLSLYVRRFQLNPASHSPSRKEQKKSKIPRESIALTADSFPTATTIHLKSIHFTSFNSITKNLFFFLSKFLTKETKKIKNFLISSSLSHSLAFCAAHDYFF